MKINELREVLAASRLSDKQSETVLASAELKKILTYDRDQVELALSEASSPAAIVKYLSQWDKAKNQRTPYSGVNVGSSAIGTPSTRSGDDPEDDRFRSDNPFRYPAR